MHEDFVEAQRVVMVIKIEFSMLGSNHVTTQSLSRHHVGLHEFSAEHNVGVYQSVYLNCRSFAGTEV